MSLILTMLLTFEKIVFYYIGGRIIDKIGKRLLMLTGTLIIIVSLAFNIGLYYINEQQPNVIWDYLSIACIFTYMIGFVFSFGGFSN